MALMKQQAATNEVLTAAEAAQLLRALTRRDHAQPGPATEVTARRHAILTRTVENEVIPRLLLANRPRELARPVPEANRPGPAQVNRLTDMVLKGSQAEASAYVQAMSEGGMPTESLLLELLTPTARKLGAMWEADTCSFSEVTLGLIRLGNVMHLLSHAFSDDYAATRSAPSVLLAQVPGEQHGFGLSMVVQFFRHAGWNVRHEIGATRDQLAAIVQENWFGMVGLSVACSERIESLVADIKAIRTSSRNRAVGIMVGGPSFVARPQLAALVGADATAVDGLLAVRKAQSLLSILAREK